MLSQNMPNLYSMSISVQDFKNKFILGETYIPVYENAYLTETINELNFRISPLSFFQINTEIAHEMYSHVIEQSELTPDDVLIDVYCGIGTMTLLAAKKCKTTIGIELSNQSVQDATQNAQANKLDNVFFYQGTAESVLPALLDKKMNPDIVLLDPPRKGIHHRVSESIILSSPRTIIYISCNPSTMTRDLMCFLESGYVIINIQPFDMFCQTSQVECVVTLKKGLNK